MLRFKIGDKVTISNEGEWYLQEISGKEYLINDFYVIENIVKEGECDEYKENCTCNNFYRLKGLYNGFVDLELETYTEVKNEKI